MECYHGSRLISAEGHIIFCHVSRVAVFREPPTRTRFEEKVRTGHEDRRHPGEKNCEAEYPRFVCLSTEVSDEDDDGDVDDVVDAVHESRLGTAQSKASFQRSKHTVCVDEADHEEEEQRAHVGGEETKTCFSPSPAEGDRPTTLSRPGRRSKTYRISCVGGCRR